MLYRATTVLFQLLFEYEFVGRIEAKDFLPWQNDVKAVPYMKMGRHSLTDPNTHYLMRAVPRAGKLLS